MDSIQSIKFEAEDLLLSGDYAIDLEDIASGGALIRITDTGTQGTATIADFSGNTGTYTVEIATHDESDGVSKFQLFVDGQQVGTDIFLDDSPGGTRASEENRVIKTLSGIAIANGAKVELVGYLESGEVARVDYLNFIEEAPQPPSEPSEPTNANPVATDDSASTAAATPVAIDVLSNDSDADGDGLTIDTFDSLSAQGGSVTFSNDGFVYTPAAGFSGTDSFTYSITDGQGGFDTATVTVNVSAPVVDDGGGTDGDEEPALETIRIEAEDLILSGGYEIEDKGFASNGQLIRVPNGQGTATLENFSGGSGLYNVNLMVNDETDGVATLQLYVDGALAGELQMDRNLSDFYASERNEDLRTFEDVAIAAGAKVELVGITEAGEQARVDYLEFVPQSLVGEPPTEPPIEPPTEPEKPEEPVNTNPVATDDSASTTAATPVAIDVLSNDSDAGCGVRG